MSARAQKERGPGAEALARVFMVARPEMHPFFVALAREMKERFATQSIIHFSDELQAGKFRNDQSAQTFDKILHGNPIYTACFDEIRPSGEEQVFVRARELESWLGVTINQLLQSDRHYGRGFALGGLNHPRSRFSSTTSYAQVVNAVVKSLEAWREVLEGERPTLVMSGNKYIEVVARRLGIPFRLVAGSRYKNYCYWAPNGLFEATGLERRFHALRGEERAQADVAQPYLAHLRMRKSVGLRPSLAKTLRTMGEMIARQGYWVIRGYPAAKSYYLAENLRFVWRRHRDLGAMANARRKKLADLAGRRFVFYPLQTEPETSLQGLSPEYNAQLAVIATIARDLPAGVLLAVKETHFALGRRPADFHRQIEEFKNVVLLDLHEAGPDVVRASEAVVTITGTPGFEGAVMGKPVISIGRHNMFGFLDHVWQVADVADLRDALGWALDRRYDADRARSDGAAFLEAVLSMSFDMADYDYLTRTRLSHSSVSDALDKLVQSLEEPASVSDGLGRKLPHEVARADVRQTGTY